MPDSAWMLFGVLVSAFSDSPLAFVESLSILFRLFCITAFTATDVFSTGPCEIDTRCVSGDNSRGLLVNGWMRDAERQSVIVCPGNAAVSWSVVITVLVHVLPWLAAGDCLALRRRSLNVAG